MRNILQILKISSKSPIVFTSKVGVVAIAGVIGLANIGGSVGATMQATAFNTVPQKIQAGVLSLSLQGANYGTNTSAGFGDYGLKLKPNDTFSRYVNYVTGPDMGISSPTFQATVTGDAIMQDDTIGLRVWVQSCGQAWNIDGSCSTTPTNLIGAQGLAMPITRPDFPAGLTTNIYPLTQGINLAAGAKNYFKITYSLPDSVSLTTNGVVPVNTIQGASASITWAFNATQAAGSSSNS